MNKTESYVPFYLNLQAAAKVLNAKNDIEFKNQSEKILANASTTSLQRSSEFARQLNDRIRNVRNKPVERKKNAKRVGS